MDWTKIENIIGESVPNCIKKILFACGYNTIFSLFNISRESILEIENTMNRSFRVISEFDCCYAKYYQEQSVFKLLPGHIDFILALSQYGLKSLEDSNCDDTKLPFFLRELMQTARRNAVKGKNHAEYSNSMRFIATYIFLTSGRSGYNFVYNNLPLPSISTVSKFNFILMKREIFNFFFQIFQFGALMKTNVK